MIHIEHNYLTSEAYSFVENYCLNVSYTYGKSDVVGQIPTGLVHELNKESEIVSYFPTLCHGLPMAECSINFFSPREYPNFHCDHTSGYTCLFYINKESHDLNEGGCTEIYVEGENRLTSVLPIRNSFVTFPATNLHQATSFKTQPRFTIALKYYEERTLRKYPRQETKN